MYQSIFGKKLLIAFALSAFQLTGLNAEIAGNEQTHPSPPIEVRYKLIDIGETDVDPVRLTKTTTQPSLAPKINSAGQIIGNRREGGFLKDPILGDWAPYIHDVTINFHNLTDKGDLLVTLNRKTNHPEWWIWPSASGKNGPRERINIDDHSNARVVFSGLTNTREVMGNSYTEEKINPVIWKPNNQLQFLVSDNGKIITGEAKWINNKGQLVGYFEKNGIYPPGVWSSAQGLQFIRNYRSKPVPDGEAELADILIADDATVYGTYRIKYPSKSPDQATEFYAYAWLPYEGGGFKVLDLDNMRITALNDWHSLVGTLDGEAAVCEPGQKPFKLSRLVTPGQLKGWELLEATDINNWGDIVGYGKFNGKMHIFLAEKIDSKAPYARDKHSD